MTGEKLQPFRNLEATHVQSLALSGYVFWVTQRYDRGMRSFDHTKKAILFSAYKELKDASKHYNARRGDSLASLFDIRNKEHAARIVNITNGHTDIVPFLLMTGNTQYLDNYLRHHYYQQYRSWVKKHRPDWKIREHNAIEPHFTTVYGEPAVKVTYGSQSVVILLTELEGL